MNLINGPKSHKSQRFSNNVSPKLNDMQPIAGMGESGFRDGALDAALFRTPRALATDGDDNIYVADSENHCIRYINTQTNTVFTIAGSGEAGFSNGQGNAAKFNNPNGLAFDKKTNTLFVCDTGNGAIRQVTKTGVVSTLVGLRAFKHPFGIAIQPYTNHIFISDSVTNKIFRLKLENNTVTSEVAFGSGMSITINGITIMAGFNSPSGLVFNGNGDKLYVTENQSHCIRAIDMNVGEVNTLVGTPGKTGHMDGIFKQALFNEPSQLCIDSDRTLYVCDSKNNNIRAVDLETRLVKTVQNTSGILNNPIGICVGWYALYIADTGGNRIWEMYFDKKIGKTRRIKQLENELDSTRYDGNFHVHGKEKPRSYYIDTLAGSGIYGSFDDRGKKARIGYCAGMTTDNQGNAFTCSMYYNQIKKITPDGIVTTIAGNGQWGYKDGPIKDSQFQYPVAIAIDESNIIYVLEMFGRVRIIKNGIVSTLAGGTNLGYQDGPSSQARFLYPHGICVDRIGNVYVADMYNHRIRKITKDGMVSTLAGSGEYGKREGAAAISQFMYPIGVVVDKNGTVFVLELIGNCIKKIAGGMVTKFAGSGQAGYKDGKTTEAMFNYPQDISIDSNGSLYICDYGNNSLRKVSPYGVVTTIARSAMWQYRDGNVKDAMFSGIRAASVDSSFRIVFSDWGNHRIRTIKHSGELVEAQLLPILDFDASLVTQTIGSNISLMKNHGSLLQMFKCYNAKLESIRGLKHISIKSNTRGFVQFPHVIKWDTFSRNDGITVFFVAQYAIGSGGHVMDCGNGQNASNIIFASKENNVGMVVLVNKTDIILHSTKVGLFDSNWHIYAFTVQNGEHSHKVTMFRNSKKIIESTLGGKLEIRSTINNYFGQSASINYRQFMVFDTILQGKEIADIFAMLKTKWKMM